MHRTAVRTASGTVHVHVHVHRWLALNSYRHMSWLHRCTTDTVPYQVHVHVLASRSYMYNSTCTYRIP